MRYRRTLLLASGLLIASATQAWAQACGSTVGNFLNAPVTPQGQAMGEASASVVTNNAMSIISNPSLLGMQGLNNKLEIGSSLSSLRNSNGHYSFLVSTASYGIQANSIWHDLPFKAGIGVGYSCEESTFPFNPTAPVKSGYVTNYANSLAVGLGFDYFVKLGLGYSVKLIKNKNEVAPIYPNINQPPGDFGVTCPQLMCQCEVSVPVRRL